MSVHNFLGSVYDLQRAKPASTLEVCLRSLATTVALIVVVGNRGPLLAQQRQCDSTENPKTLPRVSVLLDSARIVQGLSAAMLAPHGVLLSLVYTESDSFPQVHVLDAPIDSAGLLLANAFVPQKSKHVWAVRVRVTGARARAGAGAGAGTGTDAVAVTLERSFYCPPVLVTKADRLSEVILVHSHPGDRIMPGLDFRINADVIIAPSGQVTEVRLSQSSGLREFDEQLVQMLRMRRYLPALIDGFPVTSWWRSDGRTMRL